MILRLCTSAKVAFPGAYPARFNSPSKVAGTKWLICSPRSGSGQRPKSLPRRETTVLFGTSISSSPPGFNIRLN